jgi:HEPN domain-containing protein
MLTSEDKYQYWLSYAQNDLDTAEAMFKTGRWMYVYITCQQALEKLVKGLHILYLDDNVPRIHDISVVFGKFADKLKEPLRPEFSRLFDGLSKYYLRSRYPDYAKEIAAQTNKTSAEAVLNKTKEAWQCHEQVRVRFMCAAQDAARSRGYLLTMKLRTESSGSMSPK